jgi:transmembrane sensor
VRPGWIKPRALIRRQAADLLVRVDADPSAENVQQLERWRASDPRNAEELRKAEAVLGTSRLLDPAPAAEARYRTSVRTSARHPWLSRELAIAAAFSAVLVSIPTLYLILAPKRAAVVTQTVMLITNVGEIREVALADGSRVTLDTSSAVKVELAKSGRTAVVERGRARFSIAKRNAPFTVRVANAAVRVDEGIIDVSKISGDPHLDVIAGTAEVSADGMRNRQEVRAPAAVDHPATAAQQVRRLASPAVDWTSGRLSFDGARLAEVAAVANRYGSQKIVIAGPDIGDLRVTGVYKAGDTAGLARSLAAALRLQIRRDRAGNFRLEQPSPQPGG